MNASSTRAASALLLVSVLLSACGGGGGGVGTGGTGTVGGTVAQASSSGPVTGFGSVIVNGVRYEDATAVVSDDRGRVVDRSTLRLGMRVDIDGTIADDRLSGTASAIRVASEAQGPVGAVSGSTFTVLGLQVTVDADTQYADVAGVGALRTGDVVEVHGLRAGAGLLATRVELKARAGSVFADLKLRGTVSNLQGGAGGTRTFSLGGGLTVSLPASVAVTSAGAVLADGVTATVFATTAPVGNVLVATGLRVEPARQFAGALPFAQLEGLVTDWVPASSTFRLNGIPVNVANASFDGNRQPSQIVNGLRAEARGPVVNGALVATRVKLRLNAADLEERRIVGRVSGFTSLAGFTVRNTVIDASGSGVDIRNGTAADIVAGRCVEVRGLPSGPVLRATRVEIGSGNDCSVASSGTASGSGNENTASEFEIDGVVTAFTSASDFTVGNRRVNAANAQVQRGTLSQLGVGAQVEVEGRVVAGVLVASRLRFDDGSSSASPDDDFARVEFAGTVTARTMVGGNLQLVVAGRTLLVPAGADIRNGTAAGLQPGVALDRIRGRRVGSVVLVDRIDF